MRTLPRTVPCVALLLLFVWVAAPAAAKETFDSGDIAPGETFVHTFRTEFAQGHMYHCHPHPSMQGMVHVNPDSDGATTIHHVDIVEGTDPASWGYSIEHLMIEVGDTVVWTNKGTMTHTVTEGGDHGDESHGAGDAPDGHAHDASGAASDAPGLGVAVALAGIVVAAAFAARDAFAHRP